MYEWLQSGMQVIHWAVANGHAELVISLIDHFGVDPQEMDTVVRAITRILNATHVLLITLSY